MYVYFLYLIYKKLTMKLKLTTVQEWAKAYNYSPRQAEAIYDKFKDKPDRIYWWGYLSSQVVAIDIYLASKKVKIRTL